MKKKIIIFHQNFYKGGVENSTIFIAEKLKKNNFDITFASNFNKNFNFNKLKKFNIKNFPYTKLKFNFFHILNYIIQLKSKHKDFLIISNQFNMNCFLLIIKKFINFKIMIIERNHPHELKLMNYFKRNFYYFLIENLYKNANYHIGISKKLSKDYSLISKQKFKTIYNFFDFKKIKENSKKYKIKKDNRFNYNFIFIARLVDRKQPLFAVDIVNEILNIKNNKNFLKLTIIGEGYLDKQLKNYIKKKRLRNNVILKKFSDNHYPYYINSDFVISCSKYEGFCNILVEAIILNTLPISYNYPSGPSEILLQGKGGIIFNNLNPKIIARQIIKVIESPKELKKRLATSQKFLWRFNHHKNFEKYLSIINRLLK